jgi:hypothetical protein
MKGELWDALRGLKMDAKHTKAEASRALQIVYTYLESHNALNQGLVNNLNEVKFIIEETKTQQIAVKKNGQSSKKTKNILSKNIFGC